MVCTNSLLNKTMATIIDQQVALDEALVPSTKRLRIRRSNFRLPSDIQSKESTLQVVYDVLRRCPFFQAFLVNADIEHKKQKKGIEMYYPRFTKVVIHHFMSKDLSIPRRNKKIGITSGMTIYSQLSKWLSAAAEGKQPARATTHTEPTDVERTKVEQLEFVLRRSRQETHISQQRSFGTDEGTGSRPGVLDVPSNDSEEELSWNSSDDEDNDDEDTESDRGGDEVSESEGESDEEEESFDLITRTPEGSEDEGNDEEDQDLRLSEEARIQ
nr:hypothetical protein [Tanacetum cinerariifolium]